jgi:uncharacterized DUF497 family protein
LATFTVGTRHTAFVEKAAELESISGARTVESTLRVLVCFAARGTKIRIISARKATRLEHKDYEENISS